MANDDVEVIAAAAGQIIGKSDGNDDQTCVLGGGLPWNAIFVRHSDDSVAWYGHMKKNSITSKNIGDMVVSGEFLGVVGSSGNSTIPHLHFEVHDLDFNLIDPFAGTCNGLNIDTWWVSQPDYYEPQVNKLATGHDNPVINTCPATATTNFQKTFELIPNDWINIHLNSFFRDQLDTSASVYSIIRPDGTTYASWDHTITIPHYSIAQWFWNYNFHGSFQTGIWQWAVYYESTHYSTDFYLVDSRNTTNVVTNTSISSRETYAAMDDVSTSGVVNVTSTGDLTLLAQNSIALAAGFSVAKGGTLKTVLSSDICD